jgi:hypothetical protein
VDILQYCDMMEQFNKRRHPLRDSDTVNTLLRSQTSRSSLGDVYTRSNRRAAGAVFSMGSLMRRVG